MPPHIDESDTASSTKIVTSTTCHRSRRSLHETVETSDSNKDASIKQEYGQPSQAVEIGQTDGEPASSRSTTNADGTENSNDVAPQPINEPADVNESQTTSIPKDDFEKTDRTGTASTTSSDDDEPPKLSVPRSVRFGQVHIHEHAVILGDHPSTFRGPPLTIDWESTQSHTLLVDEYECWDGKFSRPKRAGPELRIPPQVRRSMIQHAHNDLEIRQAEASSRRIRSDRAVSHAMTEIEGVEVLWQSVARKFKRWRRNVAKQPFSEAEIWLNERKAAEMQRCSSRKQPSN